MASRRLGRHPGEGCCGTKNPDAAPSVGVYVAAVDGIPSAPDADSEPPELTEGPSRPTDAERELNVLRARAYGPDADIDTDPAALARLIELESGHAAVAQTVPGDPHGAAERVEVPTESSAAVSVPAGPHLQATTSERKAADASGNAERSPRHDARPVPGRVWAVLAGAVAVVILGASAIAWLLSPHPDASLGRTAAEANSVVISALEGVGRELIASTMRQFEPYHGVVAVSVETTDGELCFAAWDSGGSGRFVSECAPPVTEQSVHMRVDPGAADGFGEWLPAGTILSFHLRENTVDVFVRPPEATDGRGGEQ